MKLLLPRRRAFTLVELIVGAIILAVIMLMVTRLVSGSMKSSMKGSSHLNNIQAASLLLARLEQDIRRATELQIDGDQIKVTFWNDINRGALISETAVFQARPDRIGLIRRQGAEEHLFCPGLLVEAVGTGTPIFAPAGFAGAKTGVLVRLKISSLKHTEPFEIERVLFCENVASNTALPGWRRDEPGS